MRFSRVFYEAVFVKKYSVCKAFELAKEDVKTLYTAGESSKYMLLVNDKLAVKGKGKENKHKCFPIAKFEPGTLKKVGKTSLFSQVPANVQKFRGRQQEICEILAMLNQNRLVNILGPPGIGKTAISKVIANHIKDRQKFEDGIIYVTLRGCESAQMFLTRLTLAIQSSAKSNGIALTEFEKQISLDALSDSSSTLNHKEDERKMMSFIRNIIQNKEVLIVLDSCEDPLEDDCDQFVQQLESLLEECVNVKLLLTSRKYITNLEHFEEAPYHLHPLTPQATIRLLLDKVQRKIDTEEMTELLNFEIPDDHPIAMTFTQIHANALPQSTTEQLAQINSQQTTLATHPFTLMLGGHPQAISLVAPMLEHMTLSEVFQQLLDTNIMDALEDTDNHSYSSMRMSLEVSINHLKNKKPEALDLFKLFGLLPVGITQDELTELWGDMSWRPLKYQLIRSSMLVQKQAEKSFSLLPFMAIRAYELLEEDPEQKSKYHMK